MCVCRFVLTVKVGGLPASNTLDFQYNSPTIDRLTLHTQPFSAAVPTDGSAGGGFVDDDDSASQMPVSDACCSSLAC